MIMTSTIISNPNLGEKVQIINDDGIELNTAQIPAYSFNIRIVNHEKNESISSDYIRINIKMKEKRDFYRKMNELLGG